ncbi:MAG TPA: tRNA (N6-threonylcarbamoyladenosine(37)-N6)-methyltransferase TrmO [Caldithrix abyssi]|uniref:tRNA (N6-threonylcarbamoyladenosine(37)-N6)-methyltransferase TrmO n=1 Tax=Caldithrix abyssi TaxID=187145 RepID=A0A7V5H3H4_CALAY|nr:tRNA (N6-threonylcarbamoyladenosine(37)-N6)-methyltransferase TrmO [Caldithrix abyssi]
MNKIKKICYEPIGYICTEHKDPNQVPVQPIYAKGFKGYVKLRPEFVAGLEHLEDFSHIFLIVHMHLKKEKKLKVVPFFHNNEKGIFATRSPARPNPIGLSLVRLEKIEGNKIWVSDLDLVDGTPVLDIKPFTKQLDSRQNTRDGWVDQIDPEEAKRKGRRQIK